MSFNSRYYAYGVTHEDSKDFLHTFLNIPEVISYMQKHRQLFGDRYKDYFYKTMSEDSQEYYLE